MSNGHSCGPHYKRLVTAFTGSALVLLMTAAASYNEAAVTVASILSQPTFVSGNTGQFSARTNRARKIIEGTMRRRGNVTVRGGNSGTNESTARALTNGSAPRGSTQPDSR